MGRYSIEELHLTFLLIGLAGFSVVALLMCLGVIPDGWMGFTLFW